MGSVMRLNLSFYICKVGINLGAEHDPHERVSNERVRFPSMLLKLTTTAIVLNKGIVFNEEHFIFLFSRGSSQPRDQTQVSHITGVFFTS